MLDGEIVALDEKGRPSFQLLQHNSKRPLAVHYYAFDLLHREGAELVTLPLERRRELLHEVIPAPADPLRLSPLLEASPGEVLRAVRQLGLEGVVGKRAGSTYEAGDRSGAWIKHRTELAQEFVIGGYVPGSHGFDALIVGVYEQQELSYVAKIRNGFVARTRNEIFPSLEELRTKQCPFANLPQKKSSRWGEALTAEKMKECRWVRPELVCQIAFVEWTDNGHLRHCKFIAMREDKQATEVVRET